MRNFFLIVFENTESIAIFFFLTLHCQIWLSCMIWKTIWLDNASETVDFLLHRGPGSQTDPAQNAAERLLQKLLFDSSQHYAARSYDTPVLHALARFSSTLEIFTLLGITGRGVECHSRKMQWGVMNHGWSMAQRSWLLAALRSRELWILALLYNRGDIY
jgi:hypothetical protein